MELKHELARTEELLHKGLKEINDKGELNNQSLDVLGKTIDAIKDLCEIKESENPSYGRRHGGEWTAEGTYGRMAPEYRWYGRRDGDGDGRYNESYRGYENRYGENRSERMYGHNEDMVEKLRRDMENATSEQEREYIRKLIRKYEN
jgi:hypothetical protein